MKRRAREGRERESKRGDWPRFEWRVAEWNEHYNPLHWVLLVVVAIVRVAQLVDIHVPRLRDRQTDRQTSNSPAHRALSTPSSKREADAC